MRLVYAHLALKGSFWVSRVYEVGYYRRLAIGEGSGSESTDAAVVVHLRDENGDDGLQPPNKIASSMLRRQRAPSRYRERKM
jgi:hypothetical protein